MHSIIGIGNMCFVLISRIEEELSNDKARRGRIQNRFGGVTYNILRQLREYDLCGCSFISALSNDPIGKSAQNELKSRAIDFSDSLFAENWDSYFVETISPSGHYGIEQMSMLQRLTPETLHPKIDMINKYEALIIDLNLPDESLAFLAKNSKIPIFCDGTSDTLCKKVLPILPYVSVLKLNRQEACLLCGLEDSADIDAIISKMQKLPISQTFVTLGKDGSVFISPTASVFHKVEPKNCSNVLGAGDAYTAGLVAGKLAGLHEKEIMAYASSLAKQVLQRNNRTQY